MTEKYLVVSLGSIGRRHLQNLRRLKPDARIGVLHLSRGASGEVPQGADCTFATLAEARAFQPKAAVVCSPASTHLEVAMALAGDGVALLIEKPIAHESRGLDDLLRVAGSRGVPLMTGYNLRFLPSLLEARRLVQSGAIGEVMGVRAEVGQYLPDWRPGARYQEGVSGRRALGGGALLELSHEIDYVCWMFGAPARVTALGGRYGALEIDVEDMVSVCLEYDHPRRLVNIHLDFLQRSPSRSCKFIGSEGTLVWDGIADSVALYRADTGQWDRKEVPCLPDRNAMYVDELSHFLAAVEGGTGSACDGDQGRDVLRIVEAARESIASRKAMELA